MTDRPPGAAPRPRAGWPRLPSGGHSPVLIGALSASLVAHLAVIGLKLVDPQGFDRLMRSPALEVILVNARPDTLTPPPERPKALAQASLQGGGDLREGRSTSPLPHAARVELGDAQEDARRRAEQLQQTQQQLLAQARRELALLPPPDPVREAADPQAHAVEERRRQLLKLLAEIETRINDDSAQPRTRYIAPGTQEVAYALYYDRMRRRIEERGTREFPEQDGRKLYGDLTMSITIDARGRVVGAEILQGSGQRALDRKALAIVRGAQPYGGFTPAMNEQADRIVVAPRFRFARNEQLATSLESAPAAAVQAAVQAPVPEGGAASR